MEQLSAEAETEPLKKSSTFYERFTKVSLEARGKFVKFAKDNPGTLKCVILEIVLLVVVFGVTFAVKKNETISALLPASDCPTCADCVSYSLPAVNDFNFVDFLVVTPSSDSQIGTSWNYSFVELSGSFTAKGISTVDSSDIGQVVNITDGAYYKWKSYHFALPSGPYHAGTNESLTHFAVNETIGDSNTYVHFFAECSVNYGPGGMAADSQAMGELSADLINNSSMTLFFGVSGTTVTSSCNAYVAGNYVNVFSSSASLVSSDIITCTTYTNAFTALGIALSYALSTFSVIKIVHFIYDFIIK
jgi:hypothetical protein